MYWKYKLVYTLRRSFNTPVNCFARSTGGNKIKLKSIVYLKLRDWLRLFLKLYTLKKERKRRQQQKYINLNANTLYVECSA